MKTKEFIDKVNNEYHCSVSVNGTINIRNNFDRDLLATVSEKYFGVVDTSYPAFKSMTDNSEFIKMLMEYASTPLNKREDEPKFYVRMIPEDSNNDWNVYLNLDKEYSCIFIDDSCNDGNDQTIFTESEYNELQQRYSDWLPKFDKNDPHFEFLEL